MNRVRTLLADDHALVRAGIRKLLESMPNIEVVGEAENGLSLIAMAVQLQPTLVLMDIAMPGLNGLEATARLKSELPEVQVVILSMHQTEEYVRQALQHGAAAYLLKDSAPLEFELAITAVLKGDNYLSAAVSKGVVSDYVRRLRSDSLPGTQLTQRQREVLQLIAEGHSTKEVARRLDLSVKTVETHRSQLMKQLDIHEVTGLVRYAVRTGLISLNN